MSEQTKETSGEWRLVYVPEPAEPLPGVAEVRARWLGKWAWCSLVPEKRQRVKVYRVTNDGMVCIGVVRERVFMPLAAFEMKHIPRILKLVE